MKQLYLLELNEINFDLAKEYISRMPGKLPGFEMLVSKKSIATSSEVEYKNLEPWIQWVSVHTGLSYDEHGVFRLGDICNTNKQQIFERIESLGYIVGCISPMNTQNRLMNPAYFIPDPWTDTESDGTWWSSRLSRAIKQAVNDNSQGRIKLINLIYLLVGMMRFCRFKNILLYANLLFSTIVFTWKRALILDLFLHDLHESYRKKSDVKFTTLFLNAGAHIQHHYFLNSKYVLNRCKNKNPEWYINDSVDPIYEIIKLYDKIIYEILNDKDINFIIATGLSQIPLQNPVYYYRLTDHARFLEKIGLNFTKVKPRMTRDFLIEFANEQDAKIAANILQNITISKNNEVLFGIIDNRGAELFVTLTYGAELFSEDFIISEKTEMSALTNVTFVAIKNGIHCSKGYAFFSDDIASLSPENNSHVKSIYTVITKYFDNKYLLNFENSPPHYPL